MEKKLRDRVNFWCSVILIAGAMLGVYQWMQNIGFIATSTAQALDEHKTLEVKRGEEIRNELHDLNGRVQELSESNARIEGALNIPDRHR